MRYFEDQTDVQEWLEPLSYEEFWREVSTFALDLPSRAECDDDIAQGGVPEETVLFVLKGLVRLQVIAQQELPVRIVEPWMALH